MNYNVLTWSFRLQFLCVCGYGGLIYTSNIFYQRYEDFSPSQLMVCDVPLPLSWTIALTHYPFALFDIGKIPAWKDSVSWRQPLNAAQTTNQTPM